MTTPHTTTGSPAVTPHHTIAQQVTQRNHAHQPQGAIHDREHPQPPALHETSGFVALLVFLAVNGRHHHHVSDPAALRITALGGGPHRDVARRKQPHDLRPLANGKHVHVMDAHLARRLAQGSVGSDNRHVSCHETLELHFVPEATAVRSAFRSTCGPMISIIRTANSLRGIQSTGT